MSYRHKLSSTLWKSCRPLIIFKRLTHNCYHCHRRNHNWSLRPFYRTMPMHSADYAVARCQFVCLSVCLSVCHTPVLWQNGWTYHHTFSTVAYPHHSFFHTKCYGNIPIGTPNGDVECRGIWKNYSFRPTFRFMSEMIQDRAKVTTGH